MNIITLAEKDLTLLRNRFSHLKELDFTTIETLTISLSQLDSNTYKISKFLSFGVGYIDGYKKYLYLVMGIV